MADYSDTYQEAEDKRKKKDLEKQLNAMTPEQRAAYRDALDQGVLKRASEPSREEVDQRTMEAMKQAHFMDGGAYQDGGAVGKDGMVARYPYFKKLSKLLGKR